MADKTIGELPQAPQVQSDSLIPLEQGGQAMKMTGEQFAEWAKKSAAQDVQRAVDAADAAEKAKDDAVAAADRADAIKLSIDVDAALLAQAVTDASRSAADAATSKEAAADSALLSQSWAVGGTGSRTGEDTNNSKYWAGVAQAEADRATVPPVENVYNLIIPDRVTGQKYALLVKNGRLVILGVADTFTDTQYKIIDSVTGLAYVVVADNGRIAIEEV